MKLTLRLSLLFFTSTLLFFGCQKADDLYSVDVATEFGQLVGEVMAAVDESGGTINGAIAQSEISGYEKSFARLANDKPIYQSSLLKLALPEAQAAVCGAVAFGACAAAKKIRNLADCTTPGGGTLTGNVTLRFTGSGIATCTIPVNNDAVSWTPSFTMTGLRGATFANSATSTGQTLTRAAASTFIFTNSGIRRTFVTPQGSTILDMTTSTSASTPITVSGSARAGRIMTGGNITIVNNLTAVSCTLTPTAVSWGAGCNCPTAGTWSAACTDSTNFSVAFTSTCGQATVTKGTEVTTITMDRCE